MLPHLFSSLLLFLLCGLFVLLGKWRLKSRFQKLEEIHSELDRFLEVLNQVFDAYRKKQTLPSDALTEVYAKADRVQELINGWKSIGYNPAFGETIQGYQMISNLLPRLATNDATNKETALLSSVLLQYKGHLIFLMDEITHDWENLFICLREGIRLIVAFPATLLNWTGVLSPGQAENWRESSFAKVLSGLGALISLVSAVTGLITGWEPFTQIVEKFLSRF